MTTFTFAPATREQARARIGIQGPAGCGKTKSSLRIAEGLAQGGPIGLVDTERRSALTYAAVPGKPHLGGHEFGHMPMDSYDPRNLIQAVHAAELAKLAVLIVDSWSHFWSGRGGLLEIVDQAGSGALGTFGGWKKGNPIEQDMLDALLNFSGHLIVTMRTKTDYLVDDSGPKKTITKVGTKVIQRDSSDYEVGLIIDMVEGTGTVTKTRYEVLDGLTIHHPGQELGLQILEQLGQGVDPLVVLTDGLAAEDLSLETVLRLNGDAVSRHLMQAGILHPRTADPTTVQALLAERIGGIVAGQVASEALTYQGALDLYGQCDRAGVLTVPHADEATPDATTLGDLIKARGTALKPKPAPSDPATPAHASSSTTTEQDLRIAMGSEHPEVAESAEQELARRQTQAEPAAKAESLVSAPQMRMMHACFAKVGLGAKEQRAERLQATALIIGRQIESANELTFDEAATLLDTLSNYGERDTPSEDFAVMIAGLLATAQQSVPA